MQQIAALISGIVGAELGTAYFYQRGTSTPVNYYTDFEGTALVATGTLALDAYGGGSAYVNQLTRVLVKNSAGTTIRDFVVGNNAKSEEILNAAFTGAAYVGGALAPGNPTTLDAILTAWLASAGATGLDWKVQYNGVGINLSSLAAKIGTPVFNVKAPEYGAVGDGVANDLAAINLAKTAAVAAGGGIVFFPPGTYKISTTLTLQDGVSLQGSGATGTSIVCSANNRIFNLSTNTNRATVSGLTLKNSIAATAGTMIAASVDPKISFFGCVFGDLALNSGPVYQDTGTASCDIYFEECTFNNQPTAAGRMVAATNSTSTISASRCRFIVSSPTTAFYIATCQGLIAGCVFDLSGFTAGTITQALVTHTPTNGVPAPGTLTVIGCTFTATGGGTSSGCIGKGSNLPGANTVLFEAGNIFYTNTPYVMVGAPNDTGFVFFGSRVGRSVVITDNSATLSIADYALAYETVVVIRTTNTDQAITLSARTLRGMSTYVVVHNNSGGTIASETIANGAAVTMLNGNKKTWLYKDDTSSGISAARGVLVNGAALA